VIALIVACAFFMEMLDGTVIATALPQMARTFHESAVNVSVGMTAYLLTLAVFIPVSGWLADRFGARTIFRSAILVFTLASVLCGFSGALWQFVAARIVQGIGGAMMVPVGRLVVLRTAKKHELVRAMAFITTPGLVAPVLGPPLGGFITTYLTWRWIFFLNVPIGIAGLVLIALYMPNPKSGEHRAFDPLGFVLTGAALASFMYGIELVGRADANLPAGLALCAAGCVVGAWAWFHLERSPKALLDLRTLRIPTYAAPMLWSGVPFRIVIGTTPFLWPLMFQIGFGLSPFVSGLLIIGCAIGDVSMKAVTTRILRRFGFRNVLIVNGVLVAAFVTAFATFSRATPIAVVFVALVAVGVCRSVQFTSLNALSYSDVPPAQMGAASSLASTLQQLSFGLGIAFGALALHGAVLARGGVKGTLTVPDFHLAFVAVGGVALLSVAGLVRLAPHAGAEISGHPARS
jgi:EmrB/QacA subfamily drug resistance transporter